MKEVGSVADVVIVLSDADPTTNLAIASTVQGVDVIIAGGEATQESSENQATGALILSPGYPGRSMGVVRAVFDSQGHLQKYQLGPCTVLSHPMKTDQSRANEPDTHMFRPLGFNSSPKLLNAFAPLLRELGSVH